MVDAEGDVFANSITTAGGTVTLSSTTASTLTVENHATIGDAITDIFTINSGSIRYENFATSTILNNQVNAFSFTASTTQNPLLSFDTLNFRVGVASTAPSHTLSVQGNLLVSGTSTVGSL
ncbi:MAG: hypothetical protein HYT37_04495, partial [Candidatus Sungbacteria bacterium]|nr:hypothetical protein [Candidatus Sungbacteria bacterium]